MTNPSPYVVDRALAQIDSQRKKLREEFEEAMAKLDNDERHLLGLRTDDEAKQL